MKSIATGWSSVGVLDSFADRDISDPLGIRAWGNRVARRLVPGLTQSTVSTRGFSLLCLGLDIAKKPYAKDQEREVFLRFERLWLAAQIRHGNSQKLAGSTAAARYLTSDGYPLSRPVLTDQLSSGIWGQYRRAAVAMGLIGDGGSSRLSIATVPMTSQGRAMAAAARKDLGGLQLERLLVPKDAPELVPLSQLDKINPSDIPSKRELDALSKGMKTFDDHHEGELIALRRVFDDYQTLSIAILNRKSVIDRLTPSQSHAAQEAKAVRKLLETVEKPFRSWISSESLGGPEQERHVIPDSVWKVVKLANEPDMTRLAELSGSLSTSSGMEALYDYHQWISSQRGTEPWGRGHQPPEFELPTFTLDAAANLFKEGVLREEAADGAR